MRCEICGKVQRGPASTHQATASCLAARRHRELATAGFNVAVPLRVGVTLQQMLPTMRVEYAPAVGARTQKAVLAVVRLDPNEPADDRLYAILCLFCYWEDAHDVRTLRRAVAFAQRHLLPLAAVPTAAGRAAIALLTQMPRSRRITPYEPFGLGAGSANLHRRKHGRRRTHGRQLDRLVWRNRLVTPHRGPQAGAIVYAHAAFAFARFCAGFYTDAGPVATTLAAKRAKRARKVAQAKRKLRALDTAAGTNKTASRTRRRT